MCKGKTAMLSHILLLEKFVCFVLYQRNENSDGYSLTTGGDTLLANVKKLRACSGVVRPYQIAFAAPLRIDLKFSLRLFPQL